MARWEFKLPDIGEGVAEGEVVRWLVQPGDAVREDQPMVEVMTDKATVTIGAPRAGRIVETHGKVGEMVAVQGVLVVFELGAGTHDDAREPAATAVGDLKEALPGLDAALPSASPSGFASAPASYRNDKPLATPATRRMARERNVDLHRVIPTGPQGRTTRSDVEEFLTNHAAARAAAAVMDAKPRPDLTRTHPSSQAPVAKLAALEDRVPFAGVRRKIAAKMTQSKSAAAHFTFVEECDVSRLKSLRERLKAAAEREGVKLSYLPFVVKAATAALKKHPILNTTLDEATNELVFRRYYNIGIAAATDAGLVVPVVKEADKKSLLGIARDIDRMATEARNRTSKVEDLTGSTFTITSLGAQAGLLATPIINFPEVAILGVHRIKERPVVRDGQIVIGEVMLLSLSFDHRIVDGHVGAAFAYEVINYLENPDLLFLDMV